MLTCGEAVGVCPTSPKLDLQERLAVLLFVLSCVELKSIIIMFTSHHYFIHDRTIILFCIVMLQTFT